MSKLRSVSTSFWSDPYIEDLEPEQKLLFVYLVTNEKTNMLGIYESSIKKMSFETSVEKKEIEKTLKKFQNDGKVKYQNNYVILINYMKHQNYNTNMKKSAIDTYNNLPKELIDSSLSISKTNPIESFETLSNHFGMVRKYEVEIETKDEIEVESNVYSKEVNDCFENCLKYFDEHLKPKNEKQKNNWLDTIDKLNRIEKIEFHLIQKIVKKAREDDFWSTNFLSLPKLRKKNPEKIMYIVVFYEKFKTNGKSNNQKTGSTVSQEYIDKIARDLQS